MIQETQSGQTQYLVDGELVAAQEPKEWHGLSDAQWVNIVNHDNCYLDQDKEDAVNLAVKLTEERLKLNNAAPCARCKEIERKYTESVVGFKRDLQDKLDAQRKKSTRLQSKLTKRDEELTGAFNALAVEQGMRIAAENRVEGQAKEIERLTNKCSSYKLLADSQEKQISTLRWNCRQLDEAKTTLESERIEAIATKKKLGEEIIKAGALQSKLTERDEEIRIIRANLAQLEKDFDRRNERIKALEAEVEQWKIHAKEILSGEFDKVIHGLDLQATIERHRRT